MSGERLVTLAEVREAAGRLEGVAIRTPLLAVPELPVPDGVELRLKLESLQRSGAFKLRGAWNYLSRLDPGEVEAGVVTYSSGNHAQAVALAAGLRGVQATVVMPTTAPAVKREGARRLGAEVILEGTTSEERRRRATELVRERGLALIPPFDDPAIIAGQGTATMEILEDWPGVDLLLVPVGGGGLLSGAAVAAKALRPECRVVGVEPEGAASMSRALEAGGPVTLERIDTIADGLAPVRTGDLTFAHARELVDEVVTVPDEEIRRAASILFHRVRVVVEFSGAAALAALLSGRAGEPGGRTVAIVSGGNLDSTLLGELG